MILKTLALVLLVAVAGVLLVAARRPDHFTVQRSLLIHAGAEQIHPLIADLHRFNTWNPYDQKDPAMQRRYEGPASGPGAAYAFKGNGQVGEGRIELLSVEPPHHVAMRLQMIAPMAADNRVDFTLVPQADGTGTLVTWAMAGQQPFLGRLVGVFIDIDRMVGGDFDAGLASLKALAERSAAGA